MSTCLGVNRNNIGSQPGKLLNIPTRILNHHMYIKYGIRQRPERGNHRITKRNLGHKHPVHNIQMNIVCSCTNGCKHILSKS